MIAAVQCRRTGTAELAQAKRNGAGLADDAIGMRLRCPWRRLLWMMQYQYLDLDQVDRVQN